MKKSPLDLLKLADSFAEVVSYYEERLEHAQTEEETQSYLMVLEQHLMEYENIILDVETGLPVYQ